MNQDFYDGPSAVDPSFRKAMVAFAASVGMISAVGLGIHCLVKITRHRAKKK